MAAAIARQVLNTFDDDEDTFDYVLALVRVSAGTGPKPLACFEACHTPRFGGLPTDNS